ncbi:MAG: hypothetical protein ABI840_01030 [bacterium]
MIDIFFDILTQLVFNEVSYKFGLFFLNKILKKNIDSNNIDEKKKSSIESTGFFILLFFALAIFFTLVGLID